MQIVSIGVSLPEMSNPVFWKKKKFNMSSAENFTPSAVNSKDTAQTDLHGLGMH